MTWKRTQYCLAALAILAMLFTLTVPSAQAATPAQTIDSGTCNGQAASRNGGKHHWVLTDTTEVKTSSASAALNQNHLYLATELTSVSADGGATVLVSGTYRVD